MTCRDRTREFVRYRDSFRGAVRPPVVDSVNENSKLGKRCDFAHLAPLLPSPASRTDQHLWPVRSDSRYGT